MPGTPQRVTYELTLSSLATSGEKQVGTITAPSTHDLRIVCWLSTLINDNQSSQPLVTHRIRRCSTAGTGTATTGTKVNPKCGTAIASSAKKAITVDATLVSGDGPQDGATIAFNSPLFKEYPRIAVDPNSMQPVILAGEMAAFTIERNGASTTTPNAIVTVTVEEIPI